MKFENLFQGTPIEISRRIRWYFRFQILRSHESSHLLNLFASHFGPKCGFKHQLEHHGEESSDQVLFYGVNNNQFQILSGNLGLSGEWETVNDNEITFEFKADRRNSDGGFYLYLMCK